MKVLGIIGAAALSLLPVIAGPVYAQQDQQDEKKGHLEQSLEESALPVRRLLDHYR